METKFNFKSAICTSRVQSERLLSLGLKKETADMAYLWYGRAEDDTPLLMDKPSIVYQGIMTTHDLPAWSMSRLIEMMPLEVTITGYVFPYRIPLDEAVLANISDTYDGLIDAFERLIKEGYFPKEYLV